MTAGVDESSDQPCNPVDGSTFIYLPTSDEWVELIPSIDSAVGFTVHQNQIEEPSA